VKRAFGLGSSPATTRWFVVIGARRTGTNILRELLNTNPEIAMLGEVFNPDPAPAHWLNFLSDQTRRKFPPPNSADAASLLDEYLQFAEYRIRNHWQGNRKTRSRALGLDIKYDQLQQLTPDDQQRPAPPFLLRYFRLYRVLVIHTIRKDVIKCAISDMIAQQRNLWHNYDGAIIDRAHYVDPNDCLSRVRLIMRRRAEFGRLSKGCRVLEANYEQLVDAIMRTTDGPIAQDAVPLSAIARALRVPPRFSYDGRLQRAINAPYSNVLSNHAELRRAVADSEFSEFAASME
jgi:LPS sulfotransferase NodH